MSVQYSQSLNTVHLQYYSCTSHKNNGTTMLNCMPKIIVYVSCINFWDLRCIDINDTRNTRFSCIVFRTLIRISKRKVVGFYFSKIISVESNLKITPRKRKFRYLHSHSHICFLCSCKVIVLF